MKEKRVRRCARPRRYGQGREAVLGIHGYTGYPGELEYPARKLADHGFTVAVPRLPGHGTWGEDFQGSNGNQWLRAAEDAWLELASDHEKVHVMGHSMGGILAVLLAARFPVEKLVLMAPALKVCQPLWLAEWGAVFLGKKKSPRDWEPDSSFVFQDDRDEDDDLFLGQEYWSWHYVKQLAELSRLRRRAVKVLPRVQARVLTILGAEDRTVPPAAASLVEQYVPGLTKTEVLENTGHLCPYGKDFEKNAELILNWFVS